MTFIEAIYGSQYSEIIKRGKDGSAGRLSGNLFLSAFIIISLFLVLTLISMFFDGFADESSRFFRKIFGHSSGKTIGRLLAIPLLALIYFVIAKTVGSAGNYEKMTKTFDTLPEEEKQKANKKALIPFFIVLGIFFIVLMSSVFMA